MDETWTTRDLPVLQAVVETYEETGLPMGLSQLEAKTGFDASTIQTALRALDTEHPLFISEIQFRASGGISHVGSPTGHARRAVGAWPTAETIADQLIQALGEAAEREPDEERKGFLRKSAAYLGSAGRDLVVEIGATAINRQIGL